MTPRYPESAPIVNVRGLIRCHSVIDLLQERGWSREQAYVLCSVAADLRISNVVDVPNYVVSALLPEAIFTG